MQNIPPHRLIRFLEGLYDIHSEYSELSMDGKMERCIRWMDAVLPPEVEVKQQVDKDVAK